MRVGKRLCRAGLIAVAAGLAAACQRVETDYDPFTDFSACTSYVWDATQTVAESEAERDYPQLLTNLRDAVGMALLARGLQETDGDHAAMRLRAHFELAPSRDDAGGEAPERKLGPLVLMPYSVTQMDNTELNREMQEGTILLTMTDCVSGQPIWQGWIQGAVKMDAMRPAGRGEAPDAAQGAHRYKRVKRAVDRLLAEFPPEPIFRLSDEGRAQ